MFAPLSQPRFHSTWSRFHAMYDLHGYSRRQVEGNASNLQLVISRNLRAARCRRPPCVAECIELPVRTASAGSHINGCVPSPAFTLGLTFCLFPAVFMSFRTLSPSPRSTVESPGRKNDGRAAFDVLYTQDSNTILISPLFSRKSVSSESEF